MVSLAQKAMVDLTQQSESGLASEELIARAAGLRGAFTALVLFAEPDQLHAGR